MRYLITLALALILFGCQAQEKLTKAEWQLRYKPETLEQAQAMADLETKVLIATADADSLRQMNNVKMWCGIGIAASVFAMAIGYRLIGGAGVLACFTGFALAYFGVAYGWLVAIIGAVIGVIIGGYACWIIVKGFKELFDGNEKLKKVLPAAQLMDFNSAQNSVQSPATKVLVDKMQAKIKKLKIKRISNAFI